MREDLAHHGPVLHGCDEPQPGAAVGTWLAGVLFEATGGYGAAFAIAGIILLGAAALSLRIDSGSQTVRWAARPARI